MAAHLTIEQAFGLPAETLADRIGNLRYDELALLLEQLGDKLERDSRADLERGRPKLAAGLGVTAGNLHITSRMMEKVWEICAPHMQESEAPT